MTQPLNILVVDDEPAIRETLQEYFTELGGFSVVTAGDGLEAIEKLKQGNFDAAFLDLQMPRMTGLELLHHIKERDNTMPVIIMTGFPSLDAAIDTMRHGASDFLTKPVRLNQLQIVLDRVVRERRLLIENLRLTDQLKQKEAIERLNEQLNRKVKEQALLFTVSETISSVQESALLYPQMVQLTCQLVGADQALFMVMDQDNEQLVCLAGHGFDNLSPDDLKPADSGPVAGCLNNIAPAIYNWPGRPIPWVKAGFGTELTAENLICLPLLIRNTLFGVLTAAKANGKGPFSDHDLFLLQFLVGKAALSVENVALYESVLENLHATLRSLVTAIQAKDFYTQAHSQRVTELAVAVAEHLELSEEEVDSMRFSGYLHDIGKIGISDHILTKPGQLTDEEFEIMRSHPVIGEEIIAHLGLLPREKAIIRHHHERWDGRGYPDGLSRTEIPLLARIIAVADAYDAMTSTRPYRKALSVGEALNEIQTNAGSQFDPEIADAFLALLERRPEMM